MTEKMSPLQKARLAYRPTLPTILRDLGQLSFEGKEETTAVGDVDQIKSRFPRTFGRPFMYPVSKRVHSQKPLRVGVVLSGGQAAGGHNVITGLFDALKEVHLESVVVGFLGGPGGIVEGEARELSEDELAEYRNQGGFDLIGSGRTKIESDEQLQKSLESVQKLKLDGLVVIGGDDSNTNAAILAEYFLQNGCETHVIGVPKTIDGDLKNEYVEVSFGFDTACKTYSEMIGNIARDTLSAKKYTHFIKLMGRSASHIALECALQTHPNITLLGEEVAAKKQTLEEVTNEVADVIEKRGNEGKNYGVVLIPEGLIEFIPEMDTLIQTLNELLSKLEFPADIEDEEKIIQVKGMLSEEVRKTYGFLPKSIQLQLLLDRDPHGNIQVSHIQTEELLSASVARELKRRQSFKGKFNPLHHFFGYEGRAGFPSNFDATYCYALGFISALLIREGLTGYMSAAYHLHLPAADWKICGIPITSLMNLEVRKGKEKPVIRKALVDLEAVAFKTFQRQRDKWKMGDHYRYPGPIQYIGEVSCVDAIPLSLRT
jgi:pyrophosphate--fructose-6-phosphate 1-phosphotransferase